MKPFFAILLLVIGVCVACASRSTSSQTPENNPSVPVASPSQTANVAVTDKEPCSLNLDQAPVINGLRLGITVDQVLALFPGSSEDAELRSILDKPANQLGVSSFVIRTNKLGSIERFAGISQITFTLLDGRVSRLHVGYNGPEYSHVDKFVAKFTEGTNLSAADVWEPYVGLDTQMKTLKCNDFEVQIFAGGKGGNLNYVLVRDLIADKTIKDRRVKASQKASP
ncbi:MAG TPA: hypothetical protein VEW46_01560 [Pyrinomonadaceae bacterium]|nr:hypothetical protein [Pyrinomonadaceae bacterium]